MIQSWTEDPEFHDHIELSLRDDSIGGVMLHQSQWQQCMLALSECVSSFLTAHQHIKGHSVP